MIVDDINPQLMSRQLQGDVKCSLKGYKLPMKQRDRYRREAAHPLGKRILEAIGDDTYDEAAAKVQIAGGQISAPGIHKWVTKDGNITEPNVGAFCRAYGIRPAWLRYGVQPKKNTDAEASGLVESLPPGMKQEAVTFLGYLITSKGPTVLGEKMGRYLQWVDKINEDIKKKKDET